MRMWFAMAVLWLAAALSPAYGLSIGGSPDRILQSTIDSDSYSVEVYSFVFDGPGATPADIGIDLAPGDLLYAYILRNIPNSEQSIAEFAVSVPVSAQISQVGWYDSDVSQFRHKNETAPGSAVCEDDRVTYQFGGKGVRPGKWSEVLYFVTSTPDAVTDAYIRTLCGSPDSGDVLGPGGEVEAAGVAVPEPTALGLAGLVLLVAYRRTAFRRT